MQCITQQDLADFCKEIDMPNEACEKILAAFGDGALLREHNYKKLICPEEASKAWTEIATALGEDENGYNILTIFLCAAIFARKAIYEAKGIPNNVFIDTMKIFTRFVHEHKDAFGVFGFDRAFWNWRQLSGLIFRIGTLEFEVKKSEFGKKCPQIKDGTQIVSVHIPSDAVLSEGALAESYKQGKEFLAKYYSLAKPKAAYCESWLLAPALKELLPQASGILRFAADYEIYFENPESTSAIMWVFKTKSEDVQNYPEGTSLQRSMKKYLIAGGKVGVAGGILRKDLLF